jgi:hypothetical protein
MLGQEPDAWARNPMLGPGKRQTFEFRQRGDFGGDLPRH